MKRAFIALIVGGALLIGGTAGFAGSHTKSSISLSTASTARADLRVGSAVSFDIATPYWYTDGRGPWVIVRCYQNGRQVLFAGQGYWDTTTQFVLGPTEDWPSGSASCTADLGHYTKLGGRFSVEASTAFDVSA
jgi:hypothetical protein